MSDDKQQPTPEPQPKPESQTLDNQRIVEGEFSKRGSLEIPQPIMAAPADGPTGVPQAQVEATPPAGDTPSE